MTMSSELLTVTGTVTIDEGTDLPAGSLATVKLVDAEGEVLAGAAIEAAGSSTEFTLTADPALVAKPDELLIWAALRSSAGFWGTTELVAVTRGSVEVPLTKIDS